MKIKHSSSIKWFFVGSIFVLTLFFGLKPFNFISKNDVRFDKKTGGIRFNPSSLSEESAQRSIAFTNESINIPPFSSVSLYLELRPDRKPIGLGCIVEIHDGQFQAPLIIAQWQNYLIIRSRRSGASVNDSYEECGIGDFFLNGETSVILISYRPGGTDVYLNGKLFSQERGFNLIDSNLPTKGQIIFSNDGASRDFWIGSIMHFALYKDYVTPADLSNSTSFIEYDFSKFQDQHVPNQQAELFNLEVPHNYKFPIAKRFGQLSEWKINKPGAISDVTINIFGFLPLGFAVYVLLKQKVKSRFVLFGATCLLAFLFSLTIESLQIFLLTRHPSQIDLLCNSFGGFVAALISLFFK